jgi:hypothetical protein
MSRSITLAADVEASPAHIFEILSTTEGHRGFWTEDCEVCPPTGPGSGFRRRRSTSRWT